MSRYPSKAGPKRPGKKKVAPKKPAAKKVAPKKAVKSKPIPQQVVEKSAQQRVAFQATQHGKTEAGLRRALILGEQALEAREVTAIDWDPNDFDVSATPAHLTVEEQFDLSDRYRYAGMDKELPAPPPTTKRSKFWRQYQDESGKFIGFAKALTKTKDQVISRLRLRRKAKP